MKISLFNSTRFTPTVAIAPSNRTRKTLRSYFVGGIILSVSMFTWTGVAHAADLTLRWDANAESDLAGYKLFWGTSAGVYINSVDVGNATTKTITGLSNNTTYHFVVVAYDSSGNQSPNSAPLSWLNDTTPPSAPTNLRKGS